jgi:hypothetical protein
MTPDANDASGRAPRVDEAIAAYLEAADAGRPPEQSEFLARHADIAGEANGGPWLDFLRHSSGVR